MVTRPTLEQLLKIRSIAAKIRILWWGDIVKPDDHNAIVDFLNAIDEAFDVPGLDEYLAKLKYVKKGDIISSEQFNLTVDALKVAVPYVFEIHDEIYSHIPPLFETYVEYRDKALEALDSVQYASPGKIVHSANWNKRNEAILRLAFVIIWELQNVDLLLSIYLDYDLPELIITALGKVAADFDTTTEIVESVLKDIAVSFTLTTDAVSVSAKITESVLAFLDTLDLLAYIKAVHDETISSLDASPVIRSTFDFPGLLSATLNVVLSYDFPESITKLGIASTEYDFPELLSLDLTFDYVASLWIDLVESVVNVVSAHDETTKYSEASGSVTISEFITWIAQITATLPKISTAFDTTVESVTAYCKITTDKAAEIAIGGEDMISATFDVPEIIVEFSSMISSIGDAFTEIVSYSAPISALVEAIIGEVAEIAMKVVTSEDTTTETFDLTATISIPFDLSIEPFDLIRTPVTFSIERTTEAFDIPQSFGTAINGTTDAHDIPQTLDTDIDGSTKSSDLEISVARTSLEFELIYWMDIHWAYRRPVTIDNDAGDLTDYQIAIVLTPENFDYSKANPDGSDIRITDSDGVTKLPYWIEVWNPDGTSIVWTKIPSLPAGTYTIYLYYGNPDAESEENPAEVFDVFEGFETDPIGVDMSIHVGGGMTNVKVIKS